MFKRLSLFTILFSFLLITTFSWAQENGEKNATTSGEDKKIQTLKEKLATKVAQLRENQKRGFYGEIASLSKTNFTLVTETGEVKVRFSEDTKIYKFGKQKTEAAASDLKNTSTATVLGLFDEESKQHNAKVILLQSVNKFYSGSIITLDKKEGVVTIKNDKGETVTIDYEKTTQAQEYNPKDKKIAKSGLSRFSEGDQIQIWGTPSEEDNKKISSAKILRLPKDFLTIDVAGESTVASPTAATTSSATPKATPKPSPKATPKATPITSPKASPQN